MTHLLDAVAVGILVAAGGAVIGLILSFEDGWTVFAVVGAAAAVTWALIRLFPGPSVVPPPPPPSTRQPGGRR